MKAQAITWPQAFDGKGWGNGVAQQYGVSSIPTMLLLDREGFRRTIDALAATVGGPLDLVAAIEVSDTYVNVHTYRSSSR